MEFLTMILRAVVDGAFYLTLLIAYIGTWTPSKKKGRIWILIMHDLILIFIIYCVLYNNGIFIK